MDNEYFAEWGADHKRVIYIYKKVRQMDEIDLAVGQMLNYELPSWKEIALDEYWKYWFVVDVIYSYPDVDFQEPVIARIDVKHDRYLDKITYSKAIAMII